MALYADTQWAIAMHIGNRLRQRCIFNSICAEISAKLYLGRRMGFVLRAFCGKKTAKAWIAKRLCYARRFILFYERFNIKQFHRRSSYVFSGSLAKAPPPKKSPDFARRFFGANLQSVEAWPKKFLLGHRSRRIQQARLESVSQFSSSKNLGRKHRPANLWHRNRI